jgi:hypothetical protein
MSPRASLPLPFELCHTCARRQQWHASTYHQDPGTTRGNTLRWGTPARVWGLCGASNAPGKAAGGSACRYSCCIHHAQYQDCIRLHGGCNCNGGLELQLLKAGGRQALARQGDRTLLHARDIQTSPQRCGFFLVCTVDGRVQVAIGAASANDSSIPQQHPGFWAGWATARSTQCGMGSLSLSIDTVPRGNRLQ